MGDTSPRVAEDGAAWAAPTFEPKPPESKDVWADGRDSVATVAELTGDKPFAADLNRLFCQPACARYAGEAWRRLLLGVHRFADLYAQQCLDAGWEPIELFGLHRFAFLSDDEPITSPRGLRFGLGNVTGAAFTVGKREVTEITPAFIRIVADRRGNTHRLQREHHMSGRAGCALIWELPLF